jgi:hypothetical protein
VGRNHDDLVAPSISDNLFGGADPRPTREFNVHEYDIWPTRLREVYRFSSRTRFIDHDRIRGFFKESPHARTHHCVVINNQYPHRILLISSIQQERCDFALDPRRRETRRPWQHRIDLIEAKENCAFRNGSTTE